MAKKKSASCKYIRKYPKKKPGIVEYSSSKSIVKDKKTIRKYQMKLNQKYMNVPKKGKKDKDKIVKKIKLKALKYLEIKPAKKISAMNINELKEFADKFDLNPEINFNLLLYLKNNEPDSYNTYIEKYKYTLNFQDAVKLRCFDDNLIKLMINEYNNNIKNFNLATPKIVSKEQIISFSKIKLFNLLLFLTTAKFKGRELAEKICSYSIPQSLVFKAPNRFGNNELLYYFYLLLFVNFLISGMYEEDNSKEVQDFTSSSKDGLYFDFQSKKHIEKVEIDLDNFFERKKELDSYIKGVKGYDKTTDLKIKKKSKNKYDILSKIDIINIFKDIIIEIIPYSDEVILPRIKFIFYSVLFCREKETKLVLKNLVECLKINKYTKNDIQNHLIYFDKKQRKILEKNNYGDVVISQIDSYFSKIDKNPFRFKAFYYTFPLMLKQNVLQSDSEISNAFKEFLRYIYKSNIIRDIFYSTPEFNDFAFPFDDDDILEEMINLTTFLPFPCDDYEGYTEKELPDILIPIYLEKQNPNPEDFSAIICQIARIVNTCLHEQLKHYVKALIFYNSFQLGLTKRINSNLYELDEERKLVNAILIKNNNEYESISLDGGEKAEVFLYGNVLYRINFLQSLEIFKLSNWNRTIPSHIQNFNKKKNSNKKVSKDLDDIANDEDLCEFYKILVRKYKKYVLNKNVNIIEYNFAASASIKLLEDPMEEENEYIIYDYSCEINFNRKSIKDSSF